MRVGRTSIGSRIISMLLVICMVFGMVPLSAFAAESATAGNVDKIRDYAAGLLADSFADAGTNNDLSWTTETDKGDNWRYYTGVMLDALLMLGVDSDTNDSVSTNSALEFAQIYMDFNISDSGAVNEWHEGELDSVPPALTLLTILDTAGVDAARREDYEKAIHFVYNELEDQTSYPNCGGNYLHKQDSDGDPTSSWDKYEIGLDGIYMAQPFLMTYANALAAGKITNANADASTIYKQVYDRLMWVADAMYDETTGLYHHGYDVTNSKGNGHFWGRGIGWYAAGLVMCIDLMPEGQYKTDLIGKLPKLFDGMINYQDDSGLWYNVVNRDATLTDHNKNKLETSVTALMSYAMMKAYNEGWVKDSKYATAAEKAFNGIVSEKLKSGKITDTYKSSGVCDDDASYCKNSYVSDEAKGVGGVIMAAAEVDKYLGNAEHFSVGVVVAPSDMTIAAGATAVDTSNVKVSLLGSQGTIANGVASQMNYVVGEASNGKATVTVKNGDATIGTFQVKVVDPSVPAEGEGTLSIESTDPNVDTSAPTVVAGDWIAVATGGTVYQLYTGDYSALAGKTFLIVDESSAVALKNPNTNAAGEDATITFNGDKTFVTISASDAALSEWAFATNSGSITSGVKHSYARYTVSNSVSGGTTRYFYNGDKTVNTSNSPVYAVDYGTGNELILVLNLAKADAGDKVRPMYYNGSEWARAKEVTWTADSVVTDFAVLLYEKKSSDSSVFGKLNGTEGYAYEIGTTADSILAAVEADTKFTVSAATESDYSDAETLNLDNNRVTLAWVSTPDINATNTYYISVKLDGTEVGRIPVKIYSDTVVNEYDVSLSVNPGAVVATVGDSTQQLNHTVLISELSGYGSVVKYSGGSDSVATVTEDGLVTIVGEGSTTITATVIAITYGGTTYDADDFGSITATIPVVVNAEPVEVEVTYSITGLTVLPGSVTAGKPAQATATAVASDGSGNHSYSFNYSISGSGVSINSTTGVITTTSEASGTYTVTATLGQVDGNGSFKAGTVTKTAQFTVVEPASYEYTIKGADGSALAGQNITLNEGETYTPSFSVKLGDQDVTSGYSLTLSSESTAISISGTTITANKVTEDAVATVTATVAPFSRASASGTSVEFTVTVKAAAEEPTTETTAPTEPSTPSGGSYQLYTGGTVENGVYLIVDTEGSVWYAMGNAKGGSNTSVNAIAAEVTVDISNKTVSFNNSDLDVSPYLWTFTKSGNTYQITNVLDGVTYYVRTESNQMITSKTGETVDLTVEASNASNGEYLIHLDSGRYVAYDGYFKRVSGADTIYLYQWVEDTDSGDDHEHSYTSSVTKQPSCTEAGERTYTCECGESYTEAIPATGHTNAAAVEENRKNATCTEAGSYDLVVYCSVCGTKISSETKTIDALGHSYVNGVCTVCGEADPDYVEPSDPTTPPSGDISVPSVDADTVYTRLTALTNKYTYVVIGRNSSNRTATHGTDPGVQEAAWSSVEGGWKYGAVAHMWVIEKIDNSSNYYIYYMDGSTKYYLNGNGTNNLVCSTTADTQWAITFSNELVQIDVASGTAGSENSRIHLNVDGSAGPKFEKEAQSLNLYAPISGSTEPTPATPSSLAVTSDKTITVANGATLDLSGVTATVTMSDGSTKAATGLTFEHSVNTSEAGEYTVTVKYTENGKTVTDTITVTVEAAEVTPPVSSEKYIHNFSKHGFTDEDDFFTIAGSEKTGVNTITYNGQSLSKALKMNSSGKVSFTADADGKLILVFADGANNMDVTVDGTTTRYTRDSNNTVTVEGIRNGDDVVIDYGSGEGRLYYVEFVPTGAGTAYPASATVSPSTINVPNSGTVDLSGVTMEVTMSNGDKKTIQNADLTYDISGINTAVAKEYTVPVSYTEGGRTVTANVTVVVAAASSGTQTSDLWKHNFSVDGETDANNWYSISGKYSTSYTGSYGDLEFSKSLKMESSTSVSFNAPNEGTFTLVFDTEDSPTHSIYLTGPDGTKKSYTVPSNGVLTIELAEGGEYLLQKKDGASYLFYMEYASAITDGIKVTAPGPLYIAGASGWDSAAPTHPLQYTVRHNDQDITSGYTIEWSSLDSSVVQVDENGVITGLKSGTTSVTAKVTIDGEEYTDTVQVTVVGPGVSVTEEMELILGESGKDSGNITATVYAGGVTTNSYTLGYFSSDENVATVDANGVVTAEGKGEATIYTYVTHVNGYQIYFGENPSVDAIPNIYDTTKVTVTAKEVVNAHLNTYDYVIHTVSDPKDPAKLIEALTYKPSVGVVGGVTAEEGLVLTIEFNTGDKKTIHYEDPGLNVDWSTVDFSVERIQTALVTYVDPVTGEELFRDTIWVHVEDFDYTKFDGVVTYEDGIHFILDTDGINVNEEYAIVPGDASVALRNPSATSTNSGAAGSTSVTLAHGDVVTKLDNSGNVIFSNVDYLTMNEHDVEYTSWLLDTFMENVLCPDGEYRTQMNASNLLRYLGSGTSMTQLIHPNVGHVYLETVSVVDGEYRIVLGFGAGNAPYYLGYENGVWTATTEESSVYLYNKHVEMTKDYGVNYDLTPDEMGIPKGFVADPIIPSVIYNETNNVPAEWYTIVWSSSDETIAKVDQNGVVTGIKPGKATISATLYDVHGMVVICTTHNVESITKTVEVEVTSSNPTPVLDPDEMTIGVGTMPNFSKIAVMMTFPGTTGYDYAVPFDQLTFKLADAYMVDANGDIVYEKDEEGNTTTVPVGFDNTVIGTYIVPVSIAGQDFELTIYVVEDPYAGLEEADSIPGFPDAGSVRMNKTAKGVLDFTQTGVTKLELTAAGVSTKSSVDVVLIVDVSNSMGWTTTWFNGMSDSQVEDATDSQKIPAGGAGTGTDKLALAMATADDFADILLNVDGGDNTITFVTFAGADRDHGGSSDYVDSVRTPMVGIGDYTTASKVFADTKFTTLDKDGTGATYKLQIGGYSDDGYGEAGVSGSNRGNTNYDYAFGEAIDAVNQLKAKYAANNNGKRYEDSGRQIHVVFMTDGAPSHYNDQRGNGNAKDTLWDGSGDTYTNLDGNSEANWLTYIKNYNELANQLLPMIDGAYTVGFDMAHGGFGDYSYGLDDMQRVLEGLAKNTIVPVAMADDEEELNDYFTSLARALTYAGTNAQVTDVIGGNFSLFTGTSMYSSDITSGGIMSEDTLKDMQAMSFPITINSYRLVTYSDIGATNASLLDTNGEPISVAEIKEEHLGLRFNEAPEILEQITFSADGAQAYSSLNPGVDIMTINSKGERVIDAETFTYTATLDTVIHEGKETVHAKDETIKWKIGTITDKEVAMEYYAYLDGSLDNPREAVAGVYATNEYAYAKYVDVYGKYVERYYGVPQIAWGAGNVTVRFFLVNANGQYVNRAGVTFTNPANRIFLDGRAYYEAELNNSVGFTALDALAQAGLAGTNTLYDVTAGATVTNSTTAGQGDVDWVMNNSLNNIANLLTYVDSSNGFHSSVVIDIPVIMTDKGESERPMADKTVVIDYGKPMDINVFAGEELQYAQGYPNYRPGENNGKLYWYEMEVVGFATYSSNFDQRDYVLATAYSETMNTAQGSYSVISKNGDTQVRFTPSTIMKSLDQVFVAIKFQEYDYTGNVKGAETDQYYIMYKQLNVIPANVVYYETDGNMGGAYSFSQGDWTLEPLVDNVSGESQDQYTPTDVYGYDSSYNADTTFSNGSSWLAKGAGVVNNQFVTTATFTFTGDGFDIISRTGENQGAIRVSVYDAAAYAAADDKSTVAVERAMYVINKGEQDLHQIPVISIEDLPYGSYTVVIGVYGEVKYPVGSAYEVLNRGNEFYFDAVRIYNPLRGNETYQTAHLVDGAYTTQNHTVNDVYASDGELNASFTEIRDLLLSGLTQDEDGNDVEPENPFSSTGALTGAMYMDGESGAFGLADYKKLGANNEVYLGQNDAVAFSLVLNSIPTSLDLGVKSVDGNTATLSVQVIADNATSIDANAYRTYSVSSCTAQFVDLVKLLNLELATGTTYHVVIRNTGSGILSLTDLKVAQPGSESGVSIVSDEQTYEAADYLLNGLYDVTLAEFAEDSVKLAALTRMTVVTTQNVEKLVITNSSGEEIWFSAVSVDVGTAQRIWTVMLRPTKLADSAYTVTGYGADGSHGDSKTAEISVEI